MVWSLYFNCTKIIWFYVSLFRISNQNFVNEYSKDLKVNILESIFIGKSNQEEEIIALLIFFLFEEAKIILYNIPLNLFYFNFIIK